MKTVLLSALSVVTFAACGDNGGKKNGTADATPTVDAARACNAVTQEGCKPGEKCAEVVEDRTNPEKLLRRTTCVPDGTVTEGGDCQFDDTKKRIGADNCVAGYTCLTGKCYKLCTNAGQDSCRTKDLAYDEGTYCAIYRQHYDQKTGICAAACDPNADTIKDGGVVHDTCGEGRRCDMAVSMAGVLTTTCSNEQPDASDRQQDDKCFGCYLNGCAIGYMPKLRNVNGKSDTAFTVCNRYCTPIDSYKGSLEKVEGDKGNCSVSNLGLAGSTITSSSGHSCRFLNTFFSMHTEVPAELGLCVNNDVWSNECATLEWIEIRDTVMNAPDAKTANELYTALCIVTEKDKDGEDVEVWIPKCAAMRTSGAGCLSLETIAPFYEKLAGTQMAKASLKHNYRKFIELREQMSILDAIAE